MNYNLTTISFDFFCANVHVGSRQNPMNFNFDIFSNEASGNFWEVNIKIPISF